MKKVRIIILFMTLFLGMFFIMPAKVFAFFWVDNREWENYVSQFDFGFVKGEFVNTDNILIVEDSGGEYEGGKIDYYLAGDYDIYNYFAPELTILKQVILDGLSVTLYLEENFEDYDGYFYWNFEQGYWQIQSTELDYYKQMVEYLEEEIQQLENQIQQLENENQQLENQIQQLEDEIQQLEDALNLEYDRGYNDGYEIGYSEGLLVYDNDVVIIKWFVPLVVIIIVVGIIEPIILCKRRG